jgi:hypothetical protein
LPSGPQTVNHSDARPRPRWPRSAKELERNCEVAEGTRSDRSVRVEMTPRMYNLLMTPGGRAMLGAAGAIIVLAVAIAGHIVGRELAHRNILAHEETIQQLRSERLDIKRELNDQSGKLIALQTKLASVQAALDEILPAENTYIVVPNQSLIVADGHLTIGLIGSPTNQGVNININGKPQMAAAGDTINIALNPSMTCRVTVQSFDMFKAALNATCAAVKLQ